MTETHRRAFPPWDAWPEGRKRFHLDRNAAIVKRTIERLAADYGTPVKFIRADIQGNIIVYKARVGRYGKAFTMNALDSPTEQRARLDLEISSLQAACELRTILDLHGTINPETKRQDRS